MLSSHRLTALSTTMLGLLLPLTAARADSLVYTPEDGSMFCLHILDQGESAVVVYSDGSAEEYSSERTLSSAEISALQEGLDYWNTVLAAGAQNSSSLQLLVIGSEEDNAYADSRPIDGNTPPADAIINDKFYDSLPYLGVIEIGDMSTGWYLGDNAVSILPDNGSMTNLAITMLHEIAHALGICATASTDDDADAAEGPAVFDPDLFTVFASHLYDVFGTQAQPGMSVVIAGSDEIPDTPEENTFYLELATPENGVGSNSGVYFSGPMVQEVLNGAELAFPETLESFLYGDTYDGLVPGIPINGAEGEAGDMEAELSHIELQNSLMSHQNWRNWGVFMEAELAVLQDIGYEIDRREFFGFSIYNSGSEDERNVVVNDHPYYDRENGAWLEGVPSDTPWGIGLHVYGSWNDILQTADLLAAGTGAAGIRLEGVCNILTIDSETSVQADGTAGSGLMVSYGRDHVINLQGELTARGEGGVAARFDFGDNILGNDAEYRGSYICVYYGYPIALIAGSDVMLDQINGPLVSQFNVSGVLQGSEAAVYIAENALVSQINILSGAEISGDIISLWDPNNPLIAAPAGADLYTALTFGLSADEAGEPGAPDADFYLEFADGIYGAESINLSLEGGTLILSGPLEVYSLNTASGTYLALQGADQDNVQAAVTAAVVLSDNSTLETGFNADGIFTAITAQSVSIGDDVNWALQAQPDYYASGSLIALDSPFAADEIYGEFSSVQAEAASPTLQFALSDDGQALYAVRAADAYSSLATDSSGRSVGRAFDAFAGSAIGEMQEVVGQLDWAGDAGTVATALRRLSPEVYDTAARAGLYGQNLINQLLLRHQLATRQLMPVSREIWAIPFGSSTHQRGSDGAARTRTGGIVAGITKGITPEFSFGVHAAMTAQDVRAEGDHHADADLSTAQLGVQAFYEPAALPGFYVTATARAGVESGNMKRSLSFGSQHLQARSDWTGFTGSAAAGVGQDFTFEFAGGSFTAGPLVFLDYACISRPSFSEGGAGAVNLEVEQENYQSLLLHAGLHTAFKAELTDELNLGVDLSALWKHECLDDTLSTRASFAGADSYHFSSHSDLSGRDSMLLNGGILLSTAGGFAARLEIGAEFLREDYHALDFAFTLSGRF